MSRKREIMDALIKAGQAPSSIRESALLDAARAEGVTPPGSMSDAAWAEAARQWSPSTPMAQEQPPPPEGAPAP